MTFEKLYDNIRDGVYDAKRIPRPELPKDKDSADYEKIRQERDKLNELNRKSENEAHRRFTADLKSAIKTEHGLNDAQANAIEAAAYEDGHGAGYQEVAQYAAKYADLYDTLKNLQ